MTELNQLLDKDVIEKLKDVDPNAALAELTSKLAKVSTKNNSNEENDSDDDNDDTNDDTNEASSGPQPQIVGDANRKKLREKLKSMRDARRGRDFALQKDINMIKENSMYQNMGNNMDVSKVMMQMIGNMGHSSKQKKMMKKRVDKMLEKMES